MELKLEINKENLSKIIYEISLNKSPSFFKLGILLKFNKKLKYPFDKKSLNEFILKHEIFDSFKNSKDVNIDW